MRYSRLPDGAQVEFVTEDGTLVSALRDWFDAQLYDHGSDAEGGHGDANHQEHQSPRTRARPVDKNRGGGYEESMESARRRTHELEAI